MRLLIAGWGLATFLRCATEKATRAVLERGKRLPIKFANWNVSSICGFGLRCFGILQISLFRDVLVLHGSGVGGGSLGYANVLVEPSDKLFAAPPVASG
jgi:cholesterol oxidase